MTPEAFVRSRPCLEEIDGFISTKDLSTENLSPTLRKLVDSVTVPGRNAPLPGAVEITQDDLKLISDWRKLLLAGKDVPAPTNMQRKWIYVRGRKPVPNKAWRP